MTLLRLAVLLATLPLLVSPVAAAPPSPPASAPPDDTDDGLFDDLDDLDDDADSYRLPTVIVPYTPGDVFKVGGSAHLVDAERMATLDYDDAAGTLYLVPGVYIRQEDAYGLRPNIGLRGASSDRSKKVTLMEDGVLFAPAPYSAPAAYYFPVMTRITGTEVFKGPAAILYGPNTIGGAINLISRDIPVDGWAGELDLAYGRFDYQKAHAHIGAGNDWGGFLVEAVHLGSSGFKELDGGGDTGFNRQEIVVKGRLNTDPNADVYHQATIKLGYSREHSDETYLGLSDADFEAHPNRRYRASQLGRMQTERFSGQLAYDLAIGDDLTLTLTLYRADYTRAWRKLNRFRGGPSLEAILAEPTSGARRVFYDVLTGVEDSASDDEGLLIGTNDRSFVSQGAQVRVGITTETGPIEHEVTLGLRVHDDAIERDHYEDGYLMRAGQLVRDTTARDLTVRNTGSARAVAAWYQHALRLDTVTLTPGFRFEHITTELRDRQGGGSVFGAQSVGLLGLGAHWAITPRWAVIAGVHQGFSPVAPGQPRDVNPEKSVNYEAGGRFSLDGVATTGELIGFYNDYSNLTGGCSFSSGCAPADLDRQFNAGDADVFGLELAGGHSFALCGDLQLPVRLAYTFTHARFGSSFVSENPQFGTVEDGDTLPYVPTHQASLEVGVTHPSFGATLVATYLDSMREVAGSGDPAPGEETDAAVVLDLTGHYKPLDWLTVYVRGENLLFQEWIVSRRPFGARPGKPFLVMGGVKLTL